MWIECLLNTPLHKDYNSKCGRWFTKPKNKKTIATSNLYSNNIPNIFSRFHLVSKHDLNNPPNVYRLNSCMFLKDSLNLALLQGTDPIFVVIQVYSVASAACWTRAARTCAGRRTCTAGARAGTRSSSTIRYVNLGLIDMTLSSIVK